MIDTMALLITFFKALNQQNVII